MALALGLEPVLWSHDRKNRALWPRPPGVGLSTEKKTLIAVYETGRVRSSVVVSELSTF